MSWNWTKFGWIAGGFLLGTYGVRIGSVKSSMKTQSQRKRLQRTLKICRYSLLKALRGLRALP